MTIGRIRSRAAARGGFTILEILVVILIIGILAALLLPGVLGALRTANFAKQVDDMNRLTTALEAFKARHGVYPPSRIRLREGTPYNLAEGFDAHSVKWLKRIWPNIKLVTYSGGAAPAVPNADKFLWCADVVGKELNANTWAGVYELEGDECLVFFLGGVAQFDRTNPADQILLHGFSKRPNNPSGIPNANTPATLTRDEKLMDFDAARLYVRVGVDQIAPPNPTGVLTGADVGAIFPGLAPTTYVNTNPATIQKLPSYLSFGPDAKTERRPWAYFSAYGGEGYRPDDCNLPFDPVNEWFESADKQTAPSTPATVRFGLLYLPPTGAVGSMNYQTTTSPFPNPYTECDPVMTGGARTRFFNATTYQLISTGKDGLYGLGGKIPSPGAADMSAGGAAYDNCTNVSGSQQLGDFNNAQVTKN